MMLTKIDIKGFKSLVDVSIDLGAINVFVGANGSGKSNILEAIGFLSAAVSGRLDQESLRYRGIRTGSNVSFLSNYSAHLHSKINLSGVDSQNSYHIELTPDGSQDWKFFEESVKFEGEVIVRRAEGGVEVRQGEEFMYLRDGKPSTTTTIAPQVRLYFAFNKPKYQPEDRSGNILWVNADFHLDLREFSIFTPSTPQLRGALDDIRHNPLGLGGSGLGEAVHQMLVPDPTMFGPFELDDVLDLIEWADEIGTNAPSTKTDSETPIRLKIRDRFMIGEKNTVSALDASEGVLYVLFLLSLVGHERSPRMFGIDNFDQSLHPRLARKLTKLICDQLLTDDTRQMFATTHNPLVLDGLNLLDNRIRLFAVDRDKQGATKVQRIEVTSELLDQAELGLSLSQLWLMGRLGGVPHNL